MKYLEALDDYYLPQTVIVDFILQFFPVIIYFYMNKVHIFSKVLKKRIF
jgi:hypothetical protein